MSMNGEGEAMVAAGEEAVVTKGEVEWASRPYDLWLPDVVCASSAEDIGTSGMSICIGSETSAANDDGETMVKNGEGEVMVAAGEGEVVVTKGDVECVSRLCDI